MKRLKLRYKITTSILLLLIMGLGVSYLFHYHYIHRYDSLIVRIAASYGLDPDLVWALIYEESYFDAQARSGAGAVGLMQVTPISVREWTRVTGKQLVGDTFIDLVKNRAHQEILALKDGDLLLDPEINLHLGCWYLEQLTLRYSSQHNSLPMVLASYNAGPSNAIRWQDRIGRTEKLNTHLYLQQIDFPETKHYVESILQRYKHYKESRYADADLTGWWSKWQALFS